MIHLKDIQQGEDVRNYPWQRLVDAVRRACNVTVAPPLEMHQSYAGTVISLRQEQQFFWYGYGSSTSVSSEDPGTPSVLDLSTEQYDRGELGSLSSDVLTFNRNRTMDCRLCVVMNGTTSATKQIHVLLQLEYNRASAGYTQVPELFIEWELQTATVGSHAVVMEKTIPFELRKDDLLRVTGVKMGSGSDYDAINANCYLTLTPIGPY